MTEENVTTEVQEEKPQAPAHGPKGEVGKATIGLQIRQMWHAAHFRRIDTSDRSHPYRQTFAIQKGGMSLKAFARKMAAAGDQVAKTWLANKAGLNDQKRSEKNIADAKVIGAATHTAKRKKKEGNK